MSNSLNSLKGFEKGSTIGLIKEYIRSLGYSSNGTSIGSQSLYHLLGATWIPRDSDGLESSTVM